MNTVRALSVATVLVVDDDPGTITTFAYALRAAGRRVLTADAGRDAIRQVADADVVVCDLNLPDISGLDVCRAMRGAGVSAPFVMITGFGTMDAALEAGRLGACRFLEKPIDTNELVAVVDQQLRHQERRTPPLGYVLQMARITDALDRHYMNSSLSVHDVARLVGLSTRHICRVVKAQRGMTFEAMLRQRRVSAAQQLLEMSPLTAKEIAFRAGFGSASLLTRTFREAVGMSPSDFRRRQSSN